jgi:arachidonate 15-lipoxygenase
VPSPRNPILSLPQHDDEATQQTRAFNLSKARTAYNYMHSYLPPLAMSANVPSREKLSLSYKVKVAKVALEIAENFKQAILLIVGRSLRRHLQIPGENPFLNLSTPITNPIAALPGGMAALLATLNGSASNMAELSKDLGKLFEGAGKLLQNVIDGDATEILKSTLFELLREQASSGQLLAQSITDYEMLFQTLPQPMLLALPQQAWMKSTEKPCEQDWFFGYLQTAGFNTTLLQAVPAQFEAGQVTTPLAQLLQKFPLTDAVFAQVIGQPGATLLEAAQQKRLFVCDYAIFASARTDAVHGLQRHVAAPIALFYRGDAPPAGHAPGKGVLQPIAIQLGQQFDPDTTPIFTPNNGSGANDAHGLKWKIAKFITNSTAAMHHETVAHFGFCHLVVEPVVVAANRQLSQRHPLYHLLAPHFRFNIEINNNARKSLIAPGGVVATDVGLVLASALELIVKSRENWRWDEQSPERLFSRRGVDQSALPEFAFRDDTLLLWAEIKSFVGNYVALYYPDDAAVVQDSELQACE